MTSKTSLFRGAALGAIFALGFGAVAQAKPVKHHHHDHHMAQANPESAGLATEVDELKAQVSVLEAKLDAQASAQQQTQAQAQQAQATAQAAASQAQSAAAEADAGIKTIPGDVQVEVAKATPKPGWWGNTQIGGTVFYDMTNIDQKSAGVNLPGTPNGVAFDIKRMYISVDHQFNSVFSANLTTDFNYDSGPAGATQLYIKKAFIQAKLNNALIIRAGSADLPWVPFVEGLYGYRYVENVMIDRTKFGTSADWGLHALGSIPLGGLTISYAGSVIDGKGYKKPGFIGGVNHTDSMDFEGRLSAAAAGFTAAVGGYDGKLGNDVQGTPIFHDATRFDALLAYVKGPIRLGGEYFHASNWNDVTQANPLLTNKTEGWSGWGSFAFTKQLSVFGRYDWVKPKDTTAPTLANDYFNIGLQYEPVKVVDFSLVYKRDKVSNGTYGDQNGTIGGVPNGTYDEIGLFGQIKW
jgi:hypothetical protein